MYKVVLSWSEEEGRTFIISGEASRVDELVKRDEELYADLEVSEETFDTSSEVDDYVDDLRKTYDAELTEV